MSIQRDIDAELRFHFDARIEELIAQGASPDQARATAVAEFGDVDQTRNALREIDQRVARRRSRTELLDALRRDLVYSVRSLRKAPVVALTIIMTLALGIGVNAAMFSLLDVIYFRGPAGVARPAQVRRVWTDMQLRDGREFVTNLDYRGFEALRRAVDGQADIALATPPVRRKTARGEDAPTVGVVGATATFFNVLELQPAIGRFYSSDEDTHTAPARVAVVSYDYWKHQLDGDVSILGRTLILGVEQFTVIGVAPRDFRGIDLEAADVWIPLAASVALDRGRGANWWEDPNENAFQAVLRAYPNAKEAGLNARMTVAMRGPNIGYRQDTLRRAELGAINVARGPGERSSSVHVATRLAAVAVIVLLIACANVLNLLLARAIGRRREIAVRLALGVSRGRLVRLLLTESIVLAFIASVAALVGAQWASVALRGLLLPRMEWAASTLHWRVVAFALVAAAMTGLIAGLAPALQSAAIDLGDALKYGARGAGRQRHRLRDALVIAQAALSVVLLVGAVLFIRSLRNVEAHDVGYSVDRLVFADVAYDTRDSARDASYPDRLRALGPRIAALPGVERVAFSTVRPKYGFFITSFYPDADTTAHRKPDGFYTAVTPEYFAASGLRFVSGRTFDSSRTGPPSIVINDAMANALWPSEPAIVHCMALAAGGACYPITGVVRTAINMSIGEKPSPYIYLSLDNPARRVFGAHYVIVRTAPGQAVALNAGLRQLLRDQFPGPNLHITTMSDVMADEYRPWALGAKLFTLFGLLALVVAGVGVYSTVSYAVNQRTHEFGVRLALGAKAGDVLRLVIGEGLRMVVLGVVIGVVLALAAGRFIAALLYDVTPNDPVSMLIVAMVLAAVAALAAMLPARRAARADPMSALRAE